jgi:flagellar basal body-associated protein FliL
LYRKRRKIIMDDLATVTVSARIPAEQIHAATMLMVEEYKPLVQRAVEEVRHELRQEESELREDIKNQLKRELKSNILDSLKDQVRKLAKNIDYDKFLEIDKLAEEIFGDTLEKMISQYDSHEKRRR